MSLLLFFTLILIPPSRPSVHHLVKSSPFLSFGTEARVLSPLFNTLACQPSFHSPLASSPLFSQPTPPERAVSSPLSINLFFFFFLSGAAVHFPAEECMFVVYSPSETLRASVKCIVVLDEY